VDWIQLGYDRAKLCFLWTG